jgi:hypothetical protein
MDSSSNYRTPCWPPLPLLPAIDSTGQFVMCEPLVSLFRRSKRTAFSGQKDPLEPNNTAKNSPLLGQFMPPRTRMSRHVLDA